MISQIIYHNLSKFSFGTQSNINSQSPITLFGNTSQINFNSGSQSNQNSQNNKNEIYFNY